MFSFQKIEMKNLRRMKGLKQVKNFPSDFSEGEFHINSL